MDSSLLPIAVIDNRFSECNVCNNEQYCITQSVQKKILKYENANSMVEVAHKYDCDSGKCILKEATSRGIIPRDIADNEIKSRFKPQGPTNTALFNNINIDEIMAQWMILYPDFYAYTFNMYDYDKYRLYNNAILDEPDSLATVTFEQIYTKLPIFRDGEIYRKAFKCAGCIINSDKYHGRGKHWMALFLDARNSSEWTIEFFNSSGNPPQEPWLNWMQRMRIEMEEHLAKTSSLHIKVKIVRACARRQQLSKTECGIYSLVYVYGRLNRISPHFYNENTITDHVMFKMRAIFFVDDSTINKELEYMANNDHKFFSEIKKHNIVVSGALITKENFSSIMASGPLRYEFLNLIESKKMFRFNFDRFNKIAKVEWEDTEE